MKIFTILSFFISINASPTHLKEGKTGSNPIHGLLSQSLAIHKSDGIDYISSLPLENLQNIASRLDTKDIASIASTSKGMRMHIDNDYKNLRSRLFLLMKHHNHPEKLTHLLMNFKSDQEIHILSAFLHRHSVSFTLSTRDICHHIIHKALDIVWRQSGGQGQVRGIGYNEYGWPIHIDWTFMNLYGQLSALIGIFTDLKSLIIHKNQFESLPKTIKEMIHLEVLFLDSNQFTGLDEFIKDLPSLSSLSINADMVDSLEQIPPDLDELDTNEKELWESMIYNHIRSDEYLIPIEFWYDSPEDEEQVDNE